MKQQPVYDLLERRITGWAQERSDVQAVIVVGSRARSDHPADCWADLDTIVFVEVPALYQQSGDWLSDLKGVFDLPVWFSVYDFTGCQDPEWQFVLEDGVKVDMVFTPNRSPKGKDASLAEMVAFFPYQYVIEQGMRPLIEKIPGPPVVPGPPALQTPPDQDEFEALIYRFLLEIFRAVKLARRGELWRSVQAVNTQLQYHVLALLVWHAASRPGVGGIPYFRGRFLEDWTDPRLLALVDETIAGYSIQGVGRAVLGAFRFLSTITAEICSARGLVYPQAAVEQTRYWVEQQLSD